MIGKGIPGDEVFPIEPSGRQIEVAISVYDCFCLSVSDDKPDTQNIESWNHSGLCMASPSWFITIAHAQAICVKEKTCTAADGRRPSRIPASTSSPIETKDDFDIAKSSAVMVFEGMSRSVVLV